MPLIVARLNDRAMPIDRGNLYEDPLDAVLQAAGHGTVTGGGTQLGELHEIAFCEVEIDAPDASPAVLDAIARTLQDLGAPRGSRLIHDDGERPFGTLEGLGIYLNGTDLPDAVYRECSVDHVYDEFNRLLDGVGSVHSHWQGPTETALYVYGTSCAAMRERLDGFLHSYPLCERARVVQVA